MMPMPIIIPSSSTNEYIETKKIFIDIKDRYDYIKNRIERTANNVYGPDAPDEPTRKEDSKLWLEEDGLYYKRLIRFEWLSTFISFIIYILFITYLGFTMSHCSYCEPLNLSNQIWNTMFFWHGDYMLSIFLFILYTITIPLVTGLIFGKIKKTETLNHKSLEVTENSGHTVISFNLNDNDDYIFYKELLKEFKIVTR